MNEYCLPDDYVENPGPVYFLDDGGAGIHFQPDVLPYAASIAAKAGLSRIIDVGCGQARGLALLQEQHPTWTFVGIDYGANLAACRRFPWAEWIEVDLSEPFELDATDAVIVCSDVIEHLVDPRPMLAAFLRSGAHAIVLSTPERILQYGPEHRGPSSNLCHVREWSRAELRAFLVEQGFTVSMVGLTRSNDRGPACNTILAKVRP